MNTLAISVIIMPEGRWRVGQLDSPSMRQARTSTDVVSPLSDRTDAVPAQGLFLHEV